MSITAVSAGAKPVPSNVIRNVGPFAMESETVQYRLRVVTPGNDPGNAASNCSMVTVLEPGADVYSNVTGRYTLPLQTGNAFAPLALYPRERGPFTQAVAEPPVMLPVAATVTVLEEVVFSRPFVRSNVPFTRTALVVTVTPAELLIVRLLKVVAEAPPMLCAADPVNAMVLAPAVNVPLFDQSPLRLMVCAPESVRGAPLLIVRLPLTVRVAPRVHVLVCVEPVMVRLL